MIEALALVLFGVLVGHLLTTTAHCRIAEARTREFATAAGFRPPPYDWEVDG